MEEIKERREDCPYPVVYDGSTARIPLCLGGEEHKDCLVCTEPNPEPVLDVVDEEVDDDRHNRGYN